MKIIIETLTGKLFELNVELTDTINAVKKNLRKKVIVQTIYNASPPMQESNLKMNELYRNTIFKKIPKFIWFTDCYASDNFILILTN